MLKRNLVGNYLGQAWIALMSLAFIPLYIKYLGIESYGLIGIFGVLQTWLSMFDMGMTPALNREMARFTGGKGSINTVRDLLRSIEIISLVVALVVGLCVWSASGWLANNWISAQKLPTSTVTQAFAIMGLVIALRFIEGVYRSAIVGLQFQVFFNFVSAILATLRGLGAVAILIWVSPTIQAFFIWQGLISILSLAILAIATYDALPRTTYMARFSISALKDIWLFAGGMFSITILGLLLTNTDKILLSKLLTLSEYGYYSLGQLLAATLYLLVGPLTMAWFPVLSKLHASNNWGELITKYHQGAQLVSVLVGSAAIIMIVFPRTILQLWTNDVDLVVSSAKILSLLAFGNLLNCLMWIPYQTQLAYGWTSLATRINIVAVAFIVPAIFWVTPLYGPEGAAWVWVGLNTGYVLVGMHYMHRKILISEKWSWYWGDILKPLAIAVLVALLLAWSMPEDLSYFWMLAWLILASTSTLLAAAVAANHVRHALLEQITIRFKRERNEKVI